MVIFLQFPLGPCIPPASVDQGIARTSDLCCPFLCDVCDVLSISLHVKEEEGGEVRHGALYAPVKPNRVLAYGMLANNALHSSNSRGRNGFDSVECPAPGALSSFTACWPPSPVSLFLMLSIWRFMQKCAASRPPWSPSILSAGMAACHKLSYAEIVKLRLLASCHKKAILSKHFKQE